MKKFHLLKGLLIAFVTLQFISCENEPIGGDLDDHLNDTTEVNFSARINGVDFRATIISATLSESDHLVLSGATETGEKITLMLANAGVGTFELNTSEGRNTGAYKKSDSDYIPFVTVPPDAVGEMSIRVLDRDNHLISGSFSFKGLRMILDENGNPVVEDVEITRGIFNRIEYEPEGDDGSGGGGTSDPDDEFSVKVDGEEFNLFSLTVSEPTVANVHMLKIEAIDTARNVIRIDIPKHLGEGIHQMERISNGSMLIGIYKIPGKDNLTSDPGTLNISEYNREEGFLKATFSFTAKDPFGDDPTVVEISEGAMTIHFEPIPAHENTFTASIDGSGFAPSSVEVERETFNDYPRIKISAVSGYKEIVLSFPETVTEGEFNLTDELTRGNESMGIYTPRKGTSISYYSEEGELVITRVDRSEGIIEGTFEFIAKDKAGQDPTEYTITSGEFSIVLP